MQECRYIPHEQLPPLATQEQMEVLRKASANRTFKLLGLASRYVEFSWQVRPPVFFQAIHTHINNQFLIYQKFGDGGILLPNKLQANVVLFEDQSELTGDIYVEFTLTETEVVLIIDAHNHDKTKARYPRVPYEK